MLVLCMIAAFGWFIYGVVLMFKSDEKCGKDMYNLLYVIFWIMISALGLSCCCGCFALTLKYI